jgi:hypothetical protein
MHNWVRILHFVLVCAMCKTSLVVAAPVFFFKN